MRAGRDPIVELNLWATALFVAGTVAAAVVFEQPFTGLSVVVDLGCFAIGVVAFLWGYWSAVQRSRRDEISVVGMYFLVGKVAPDPVARRMNGALIVQSVAGLAGALARPNTDGKPGSTLAFGILVPMLGLGLNGLWAAHKGAFPRRVGVQDPTVTDSDSSTGQDENHE